jgi:hypothetical protein
MTNGIEELKTWAQWACNEPSVPARERAQKSKSELLPEQWHHDPVQRTGWATLVWSAKTLANRTGFAAEGQPVLDIVTHCLETNASALHALISYGSCGVEIANEILNGKPVTY